MDSGIGKLIVLNQITVTSPDFTNGDLLSSGNPHLCKRLGGKDEMPRLVWNRDDPLVKSWLVVCVDPDAPEAANAAGGKNGGNTVLVPAGTWIHVAGFLDKHASLDAMRFMPNSWGKREYGGACPPSGVHRYFFVIIGLNAVFDNSPLHHDLKTVLGLLNESGNVVKVGTIMFRVQA